VPRSWACEQLSKQHAGQRARISVVAGRPGFGFADRGAIVCSCFGIGANQIENAMAEGCLSVSAIGQALKAGTDCGSCRGEIGKIIREGRLQAAE
jgi:assimilatory nitrate reductase catalytic subunit